jgi:hypothetical protein
MSEHKVGEFVRAHKKAELTVSAVLAVAASAAAFQQIHAGNRRKREAQHLGYEATAHSTPLKERMAMFGYTDETNQTPDDLTRLAAFVFYTSRSSAEKAVVSEAIMEKLGFEEEQLGSLIDTLVSNNFVALEPLLSDAAELGLTATPDLIQAEESSLALQIAISEIMM